MYLWHLTNKEKFKCWSSTKKKKKKKKKVANLRASVKTRAMLKLLSNVGLGGVHFGDMEAFSLSFTSFCNMSALVSFMSVPPWDLCPRAENG